MSLPFQTQPVSTPAQPQPALLPSQRLQVLTQPLPACYQFHSYMRLQTSLQGQASKPVFSSTSVVLLKSFVLLSAVTFRQFQQLLSTIAAPDEDDPQNQCTPRLLHLPQALHYHAFE